MIHRPEVEACLALFALWVLLLCGVAVAEAPPDAAAVQQSRTHLDQLLRTQFLPRWLPADIDSAHGGYSAVGAAGESGGKRKPLMAQASAVLLYARLSETRLGGTASLAAAEHGFRFMRLRMWDHIYGGFFWEMDQNGRIGTRPHKQVQGQAVALQALAEFALVSGDTTAEALARQLFTTLEEHAWDPLHGGYLEWFRRDWEAAPPAQAYMATPAAGKLVTTQLRMAEALAALQRLDASPLVGQRLRSLVLLLTAVAGEPLPLVDPRTRTWLPQIDQGRRDQWAELQLYLSWRLAPLWTAIGESAEAVRQLQHRLYAEATAARHWMPSTQATPPAHTPLAGDGRLGTGRPWAAVLPASLSAFVTAGDAQHWAEFVDVLERIEAAPYPTQGRAVEAGSMRHEDNGWPADGLEMLGAGRALLGALDILNDLEVDDGK
jgi:hypothetical protein